MQAENKINDIRVMAFGCRLNSLEAEKIQNMLTGLIDTAIIVNTCAVTAEAERQSGQAIRRIARENPNAPIFVTGCAATRNPALFADIENVIVIKNRDKMQATAYTDALAAAPCHILSPAISRFNHAAVPMSKQFVQIQNGCNHKCAYCVTRLLRGPAVSFEYDEILKDVKTAVKNGFSEIVLTGVDIASYARGGMLISDLCKRLLNDVPGIKRMRLSSMDPASPEIFKILDLMEADARMMRHMHLSMQSGSDTILQSMGRRHNADTVRKIVQRGEKIGVTFSWDIICGFPGETQDLWAETVRLVEQTRPIKIHAFPFSARPGTPAADMPGQINRAVSKERVKTISRMAELYREQLANDRIGQRTQVLVENGNLARDPHDMVVKIEGDKIASRTVCDVIITDAAQDMLVAKKA